MTFRWMKWAVAVALALSPRLASAQCMGGSGGGHRHGGEAPVKSETKAERAIRDLLSEERKRVLLMEAVLVDPQFMRDLIERIAELPEWRALAAERLDVTGLAPQPDRPADESAAAKTASAVYSCPMHPEVQSNRPGTCPKCGMRLERKGP